MFSYPSVSVDLFPPSWQKIVYTLLFRGFHLCSLLFVIYPQMRIEISDCYIFSWNVCKYKNIFFALKTKKTFFLCEIVTEQFSRS